MKISTAFCLFVALAVVSAGVFAQEGPIKYRQGVMNAIGGHATGIAEIAYGGVDHRAHLTIHVESLAALTKMVTIAFKEDAIPTEDAPTRAKPEIWQNWHDFEKKTNELMNAVTDYAAAVKTGDTDVVATKLDAVWDSCKSCHKKYRKKN